MRLRTRLLPFLLATGLGLLSACKTRTFLESKSEDIGGPGRVGLLFASHGDIDVPKDQLQNYVLEAFRRNVGIPLPMWIRKWPLDIIAYNITAKELVRQYEHIGPTNYLRNSLQQAEVITAELQRIIPGAKAYIGFNFTDPMIDDTLQKMRSEGVNNIVVMNKGAQFSYASSGENMEDVLKYLKKNPTYDANVTGVLSYSDDPRFVQVAAQSIREDVQKAFPGVPANRICLLTATHGLPVWLTKTGDSAVQQMKRLVIALRAQLPEFRVFHGFLNDDAGGGEWVRPKALDLAPTLAQAGCAHLAMDGRLSFTVHHRATLYDLNVQLRQELAKNAPDMKVALLPNFDTNRPFAAFIAQLTAEALQNRGQVTSLKQRGMLAISPNTVGKPGFSHQGVTSLAEVPGWSPTP